MKFSAVVSGLILAVSAAVASAHVVVYTTQLSGPNEFPANDSEGTGTAKVTVDLDLLTMRVEASFSGLRGNVTASHIHCCTTDPGLLNAGVATVTPSFPGFPTGSPSGSYDREFNLAPLVATDTYNGAFVAANGGTIGGAMNALLLGLNQGRAYLNIHSSAFPGGEIRGFLQVVPEPGTYAMLAVGLGLLAFASRRRIKH